MLQLLCTWLNVWRIFVLFFHLLSHGIYAARRAMFTLSLPLDAADHQALVDAVAGFLDRFAGFLDAKGVP